MSRVVLETKIGSNSFKFSFCLIVFCFVITPILGRGDSMNVVKQSEIDSSKNQSLHFDQNLFFLDNLFTHHQQVIVTSRIVCKSPYKTLAEQETSFFATIQFLKMFPQSSGHKLNFQLTPQNIRMIEKNLTKLQTKVFVVLNGKRHKLYEQQVPLLQNFDIIPTFGIQIFLNPDANLIMSQTHLQTKVMTRMEVWLMGQGPQMKFSRNFTSSKYISTIEIFNGTVNQRFYYVYPFANKINTMQSGNYQPLISLKQGGTFNLQVKIMINEVDVFFQLLQFYESTSQVGEDYGFELDSQTETHHQLIARGSRELFLNGSVMIWLLLSVQILLAVCISCNGCCANLVYFRVCRMGESYKGISLNSLLIRIAASFIMGITTLPAEPISVFIAGVIGYLIAFWLIWHVERWFINKIAKVRITWRYPFFTVEGSEWYKAYQDRDNATIRQLQIPSFVLFILIILYPFVFQDCSSYLEREKVSLWSYCLVRLNGAMREYWMVLVLLCQIRLNARIKSGNGFSWLMIYFLMLCYIGDNIQILIIPSSVWGILFVLKEEIMLMVLVYQKIMYGNSLDMIRVQVHHPNEGGDQNPALEVKNHLLQMQEGQRRSPESIQDEAPRNPLREKQQKNERQQINQDQNIEHNENLTPSDSMRQLIMQREIEKDKAQ